MFWRTTDPKHPAYDAKAAREHGPVIETTYEKADGLVKMALEAADDDTTLIVMSDHGFGPYYRSFGMNAWLAEKGYLAGRDVWEAETSDIFTNADWAMTRAYAIGFNGVYLNLREREAYGAVNASERAALGQQLSEELLQVRDPETGAQIISRVYTRADFADEVPDRAPDLIVGYANGYRCDDASVLGGAAGPLVQENRDKWSGDHCIDRALVPGMCVASKQITAESPGLEDMTATVLGEFGVKPTREMQGKPIW
jgi:predicted AlkP superfamily phosphohydrolase/phosphomutase